MEFSLDPGNTVTTQALLDPGADVPSPQEGSHLLTLWVTWGLLVLGCLHLIPSGFQQAASPEVSIWVCAGWVYFTLLKLAEIILCHTLPI